MKVQITIFYYSITIQFRNFYKKKVLKEYYITFFREKLSKQGLFGRNICFLIKEKLFEGKKAVGSNSNERLPLQEFANFFTFAENAGFLYKDYLIRTFSLPSC